MQHKNIVEFSVQGKYALFTDPITRIGGDKTTYQMPTYESLKGILSSVYWKPTIIWIIDQVRILKPIQMEPRNVRPLRFNGGNDLAIYTYLADVEYQIQAHFEWNQHRMDLAKDRNENKHFFAAKRMIDRGGRRDAFLGTRECQAYVEPCSFGEGPGFFDQYPGTLSFGLMFHGFNYPDESGNDKLESRFWNAEMRQGIIQFPHPSACRIIKDVRPMNPNPPASCGLVEAELLEGYKETD